MGTMRALVTAVLLLGVVGVGCDDEARVETPDAMVEPDPTPDAHVDNPAYGTACDSEATLWCANYLGICANDVCREQCDPVGYPHCRPGQHEVRDYFGHDSGRTCICVPD